MRMAALCLSFNPEEQFDPSGDHTSVSQRWNAWKSSFEFYLGASGLTDKKQKRCLLLHCAGKQVQEIFSTLTETGDDYDTGMAKLSEHFGQSKNVPFQRHIFRKCLQEEGETVSKYVTRLQKLASSCDFGDKKDDFVRDQVIDTCRSRSLRIKLLSEENLNLKRLLVLATAKEGAEHEANFIEKKTQAPVNQIQQNSAKPIQRNYNRSGPQCGRCGFHGHLGENCRITKDKSCNKCGGIGHFAVMCRSRTDGKSKRTDQTSSNIRGHSRRGGHSKRRYWKQDDKKGDNVRNIEQSRTSELDSDDEYVFSVDCVRNTVTVSLGGYDTEMLIDSGSSVNIVNSSVWSTLKKIGYKAEPCHGRYIHPYASSPIKVIGTVQLKVKYKAQSVSAEIVLIPGKAIPIIGLKTATDLGLLKVGGDVNSVMDTKDILKKYEHVFVGVGKLKDYQLRLNINQEVTPVAQPTRCVPFHLREKTSQKIKELEQAGIIERVEGPTE